MNTQTTHGFSLPVFNCITSCITNRITSRISKSLVLILTFLSLGVGTTWAADATIAYSGSTTTNMTGNNDAATLGLSATSWSVVGAKGGNSNYPGLNKDGSIRLYWADSGGNTITVTNLAGTNIESIVVTYVTGKDNGVVKVGGNAVTVSGGSYAIGATSFTIGNANTSNVQVQITSIEITLASGGGGGGTKYTVSFDVGASSGSQADIQEANVGAGITLPAGPTPTCSADGWSFAGWAAANVASSTTTAPTLYSAGDNYKPADDCTLYAVYSKTTGGGSSNVVFNFGYSDDWGESSSWSGTDKDDVTATKSGVTVTHTRGTGSIYANATATRFYKDNTLTFAVATGSITSIVFTCTTYKTDITSDVGTCTATSSEFSWSGSASSVSFSRPSNADSYAQFSAATITIGSGTTNYWSSPTCAGCTNSITITKGDDPANGTFTLDNSGTVCIDDGNASTTVTASPSTHYHLATVTTIGSVGTVGTISGNTCTITGINANTTVNVTFAADTKEVVTWHVATATTPEEKYPGETLDGITAPTSSDCDGEKVFVGWTADGTYSDANDAPADLFTDPTTKTMPAGGTDYYAVFASETSTKTAGTVISTGSSGKSVVDALDGVTISGLASDYADSHSPYLLKFDDTGDYIQFDLDYPPTGFSFGYKMIGGNKTSTMTIKECATADGTYTDVQAFTISGAQNSTGSFTTTATFAQKYIRMVFTKGDNVGVGNITITGYTGTTSQSDYAVSCVTYTVTATSNNDSYGTVSVNRYTITATPATGYVADGYNLSSGTATVTQTGNTYKVHPSSDCSIQINFRAAATYTVTLYDNGGSYTETAYEGTPYELPDEGLSSCPDATFLGWATTPYTNHETGTSTAPDYIAAGEVVNITAATNYTAVYSTDVPTNSYNILSDANDLVSGRDYLIAAYATNDYPVKASITDGYVDSYETSLAQTGNTVTDATLVWTITKTTTGKCQLYNKQTGNYLCFSASNELMLSQTPTDVAYVWTDGGSGYSDKWDFKSTTNSSYILSYYSTTEQYRAHTDKEDNIYLYARQYTSTYTSHPSCCHTPAETLTIATDAATLIGSGVAHITLNGGNGQDIEWTTTGGTLSDKTNTGATLTMPATAATTVYTITATQPDDETNPDNVICGATVTINITVKAQFTIIFNTKDNGTVDEYKRITVTDGETYTMPELEEYTCTGEASFAGWVDDLADSSVEAAKGSTQTATADKTWYAAWASSSSEKTVYVYTKVTDVSDLTDGCVVLIANAAGTKALGEQKTNNRTEAAVSKNPANENQIYFTGTAVKELTVGIVDGKYTFYDSEISKYLYAASSSSNNLKSQSDLSNDGKFSISITSDGTATITAQGDNTHNTMMYNAGSHIFSCYGSTSTFPKPVIYKKSDSQITISEASSGIVTNNTACTRGAVILVESGKWITAAQGQKVKLAIPVVAKGFDNAETLAVVSNNGKFAISIDGTAVPASPSQLEATLTVEYTPTSADVVESATITFTAGEVTKNIIVNGRSLPDEFLLIAKSVSAWYALPANMNSGGGQYSGVNVTTDDPDEPTIVPVAPATVIYSLRSVTNARYATAGQYVRLAGLGNKGLWATSSSGGTDIENKAVLSESINDARYEWQRSTTDGIRYTITCPANSDAASGRQLALGGTGGTQYGFYKSATIIFIVPAGCTSQPQEVNVSPRRVDATFSWESNASSVIIDVYTNEERTTGRISKTATSSPFFFDGLREETDYWFTLTPNGDASCAVTGSFTTTGPVIDIVEWMENGVKIFVDKDSELHPKVIIDGQEEHGSISGGGGTATELFFAKYFEGAGSMKLISVFNGTSSAISLKDYIIRDFHNGSSNIDFPLTELGSIAAGQEIIFFSRPQGNNETGLIECSSSYLNAMADQSAATDNPRWVECKTGGLLGDNSMNFNGDDAMILLKNNVPVDIIGAATYAGLTTNCRSESAWSGTALNIDYGKSSDDSSFDALFEESTKPHDTDEQRKEILAAFGINLEDETINITTARCILFRNKTVTSGANAVTENSKTGEGAGFNSFTSEEWNGRSVCMTSAMRTAAGVSDDSKATCNSYQDLGTFNYSTYYIDYSSHIEPGKELDSYTHDPETKIYNIPIDELAQYSCLNIRFQLKRDGEEKPLTEATQQVPIIVAEDHDTNDGLFSELVEDQDSHAKLYPESVLRCRTCNVVVLSGATLTKGPDGEINKDVPEVHDIKIYPGGKLVIPDETNYTVNSLAIRRQEDDLSLVDVQGTLTIKSSNSTFFDLRIDPSNWHYISLPYNVNVSDITYADGTPAAVGSDFLLKYYDGAKRAATQAGGCWEMVAADATLKKGIGYIFGIPGSGRVQREFRFPMSNEVVAEEKDATKQANGVYAYGCDKDMTEVRANHRGWNLLGNPYLLPYQSDITNPVMTGYIVPDESTDPWDGHYKFADDDRSNLRYIVEPVDNGRSEYVQVALTDYEMKPFTSYFVQIGGDDPEAIQGVQFNKAKVIRTSPVRRSPASYEDVEDNHPVWCAVNITNAKGEKDETTMLISNDFTNGYDMMDDLVKMRGTYYQYAQITTKPVLASRNDEGEMAFNALPDSTARLGIPLNYFAAAAGQYKIALDGRYSLDEITDVQLYDSQLQTWHNLLTEDYSFAVAKKEDNTTRFKLYVTVERKQPQTPTEIDNIYGKLTLTANDRTLLLSGLHADADIYVYDVSGKLIDSGSHFADSDNGVWRTTVPTQGVYFVRVNIGTEQQTLNTIVY